MKHPDPRPTRATRPAPPRPTPSRRPDALARHVRQRRLYTDFLALACYPGMPRAGHADPLPGSVDAA